MTSSMSTDWRCSGVNVGDWTTVVWQKTFLNQHFGKSLHSQTTMWVSGLKISDGIRKDRKKSFVVTQRRPEFRGVLTTASHRGSVWRTAVVPVPRANPQRHVKMTGEGGDTVGADVPWGFAHLSQVREEIKEPTAAGESSAYCNIIHWQNSKQAESEGSVGGSFFFCFVSLLHHKTKLFHHRPTWWESRESLHCWMKLLSALAYIQREEEEGGGYSLSSSFPKSRLSMLLPCPWMVTVEMQRRRCVVGWMDADRLNAF